MKKLLLFAMILLCVNIAKAQTEKRPIQLKHWMTQEEAKNKHLIGKGFVQTAPPAGNPRELAEFGQMQGVIVRYPFGIPISLVKEMAKSIKVTTIVTNLSQENTVKSQYTSNGVNLANCVFVYASTDSYWTRDYGPWFVKYGNKQIGVVDFPYNRPRPNDDEFAKVFANSIGISWFGMNVFHTGGNFMSDGLGVGASTKIAYTENPSISNQEVNNRMKSYCGIETYHVVDDPNNTYIDHIDCWSKYLDVDKILIRAVPPTHAQYDEIETVVAYFQNKLSSYGTPMQIFRAYNPQDQPYTNSLILNNRVFVPIVEGQWDDSALAVYRRAMPGYEVIGIVENYSTPWESTDALHCRTRGISDLNQLLINHMPLLANQPVQTSYTINANIYPFSKKGVIEDSIVLHYMINSDAYNHLKMNRIDDTTFQASIPVPVSGSKVSYYISAKDSLGKKANHPFIGAADPHVFYASATPVANIQLPQTSLHIKSYINAIKSTSFVIKNDGMATLTGSITTSINNNKNYRFSLNDKIVVEAGRNSQNGIIDISETAKIKEVHIRYSLNVDEHFEDQQLELTSPSGKSIIVSRNEVSGEHYYLADQFENENMNGKWTLKLIDKYGDGGIALENAEFIFTTLDSKDSWLNVSTTSLNITANASQTINVNTNANGLAEGSYSGKITITSNDPDSPTMQIPVLLEVVKGKLIINPDKVIFDTNEEVWNGISFKVINKDTTAITITDIEESHNLWYLETSPTPLEPRVINKNDSTSYLIKFYAVKSIDKTVNWEYDTLDITTDKGNFKLPMVIDMDLVTAIQNNSTNNISINAFPNPAKDELIINIKGDELKFKSIVITDIIGNKKIEVLNVENSKNTVKTDVSELANGIYLCHLYSNQKLVKTIKLIISR